MHKKDALPWTRQKGDDSVQPDTPDIAVHLADTAAQLQQQAQIWPMGQAAELTFDIWDRSRMRLPAALSLGIRAWRTVILPDACTSAWLSSSALPPGSEGSKSGSRCGWLHACPHKQTRCQQKPANVHNVTVNQALPID